MAKQEDVSPHLSIMATNLEQEDVLPSLSIMATNLEQEDVSCIGGVKQKRPDSEGGRSRRMAVIFFVVLLFFGSVILAIFAYRASFKFTVNDELHDRDIMDQEVSQGARPRFVLFGDSITAHSINPNLLGYGTLLAFAYNRKVDVITRGMSGYTTRDGLSVLPEMINEFQSHPPALITIAFGTNDALRRPLPAVEYGDNLRKMVKEYVQAFSNATTIVLVTPPPPSDNTEYKKVEPMAKECLAVAAELNITVVDIWNKIQTYTDWKKDMFVDGIHFASRGNKAMYDLIQQVIDTSIPSLKKENISQQFDGPMD